MNILVLNAGSSTQKSCLYALDHDGLPDQAPSPLWKATIDWTAHAGGGLMKVNTSDAAFETTLPNGDRPQSMTTLLHTLVDGKTQVLQSLDEIDGVGHRVVHGGADYSAPTWITAEVKAAIARLIPLAPAHNPAHLEGIEAVEKALGDVPQVAVFDTAFHSQMPPESVVYPIPYDWYTQGIRRYGFHGISHEYCAHRAAQILQRPLEDLRLIICHLGNGCSLTAVENGKSISTTMGFTPLEGLMMGSRSGSIDPAILIYLMREKGMSADQLDHLLNKESGLKGVSGVSSDLREIQEAIAQGNPQAALALDLYIHRLKAAIGSLIPLLGGLDALVFTAGVGEHAADVRARTCAGFQFLGLKLDAAQNEAPSMNHDIAQPDSTVRILVIHTEEDWAIAQSCWRLMTSKDATG